MRFKIVSCFFLMMSLDFAQKKAAYAGFEKEVVQTTNFTLATYHRLKKSDVLRIYLEGDGKAWENKYTLSLDPTPSHPIALELAIRDHADSVAYIARPGQFGPSCDSSYWSQRRFAPEVVDALNEVIDSFKQRCRAKWVDLIGYSGGGALAVLLAAVRHDVASVRTVAGNLDLKQFCDYHDVSALDGSLDPIDFAQKMAEVPQRHFVGSKDRIVPMSIAQSFVEKIGKRDAITVIQATHQDGWSENWEELLSYPLEPFSSLRQNL